MTYKPVGWVYLPEVGVSSSTERDMMGVILLECSWGLVVK